MVAKFGRAVTLTRLTAGAYDPATSSSVVVETTQAGKGIVLDHESKDIDGTLVKAGDRKLLLSPVGITPPIVGDHATVGATKYAITSVSELNPAGTLVLVTCNLRGE
jgi:hypothetical protein